MKIKLSSVYVDDQDKALRFYTAVLGFIKKTEIPAGEFRWLTLVSPEDPDGTELVLEPGVTDDVQIFKQALFDKGIPFTAFLVNDIDHEYNRLIKSGVKFTTQPAQAGPVKIAIFNDTCGNLIQLYQLLDV